jgi:hypothetical protein
MKLIIAGSRTFNFYKNNRAISTYFIDCYIESLNIPFPTEIVCGCGGTSKQKAIKLIKNGCFVSNQGIDLLGEFYADSNRIKIKRFPPDWDLYLKAAGPKRNKEMAEYADALLLIWDGESKGSKNMKTNMLKLNKPIYEVILKKNNIS